MTSQCLTISAPGSIMITGEHAVVYGHPALVAAIKQRITLTFEERQDRLIEVHSDICPTISVVLDKAQPEGPLRYVFGAVALYQQSLKHGLTIHISSDIDPTLGLGSSAAVTIAMLGGLRLITQKSGHFSSSDYDEIHRQALGLVRQIQGRGSGADLAASLYGGMIAYQLPEGLVTSSRDKSSQDFAMIEQMPKPPEMSLRYCGYKTPTGTVLAQIAERMNGKEEDFSKLYERMGETASATIKAAKTQNWPDFATKINEYQSLMEELGVSDATLDELIKQARQSAGITAAKISGSGLGDCIVAFGPKPASHQSAHLAELGLKIHSSTE